jgi:hypothetical protein
MRRPLVSDVPRHREERDEDNENNPDVEAHIKYWPAAASPATSKVIGHSGSNGSHSRKAAELGPLIPRVRSIRSWRQPTRGYRLRLSAKGAPSLAPAFAPSRAQTE